MSDSLRPHGPQHARPPCPSPMPQVHWVGDAIQPFHPVFSPSPTFNLSQHQGLFQWVSSLHHRDGGAWWAAVYGVTQSWTQLMRLSSSSNSRRKDMEAQVRMEKLRRWRGTPCCPPWKGLRPTPVEKGQGWALPRSPDLHSNHSPSCSDGRHLTDCLTGGPKGWSSQSGVWAESDFLCSRHCSHVSYGTGLQLQLWQSYSSFKTQLDSHHLR